MPITKELKAALDAWKAGTGEYPSELDAGVFFPNEGAYHFDVDKKSKGREGKGREQATAEFLARLGLTDPAEIESVKEALEKSGALKTEAEKIRAELAKHVDEIKKRDATIAEKDKAIGDLSGFKTQVQKQKALAPHLAKLGEAFRGMFEENLLSKITIDGDKILAPEGKEIGAYIDDFLKANPALKAADFKPGAGTKPTTEKPSNVPFQKSEDGPDITPAQRFVNEMAAKGQLRVTPISGP